MQPSIVFSRLLLRCYFFLSACNSGRTYTALLQLFPGTDVAAAAPLATPDSAVTYFAVQQSAAASSSALPRPLLLLLTPCEPTSVLQLQQQQNHQKRRMVEQQWQQGEQQQDVRLHAQPQEVELQRKLKLQRQHAQDVQLFQKVQQQQQTQQQQEHQKEQQQQQWQYKMVHEVANVQEGHELQQHSQQHQLQHVTRRGGGYCAAATRRQLIFPRETFLPCMQPTFTRNPPSRRRCRIHRRHSSSDDSKNSISSSSKIHTSCSSINGRRSSNGNCPSRPSCSACDSSSSASGGRGPCCGSSITKGIDAWLSSRSSRSRGRRNSRRSLDSDSSSSSSGCHCSRRRTPGPKLWNTTCFLHRAIACWKKKCFLSCSSSKDPAQEEFCSSHRSGSNYDGSESLANGDNGSSSCCSTNRSSSPSSIRRSRRRRRSNAWDDVWSIGRHTCCSSSSTSSMQEGCDRGTTKSSNRFISFFRMRTEPFFFVYQVCPSFSVGSLSFLSSFFSFTYPSLPSSSLLFHPSCQRPAQRETETRMQAKGFCCCSTRKSSAGRELRKTLEKTRQPHHDHRMHAKEKEKRAAAAGADEAEEGEEVTGEAAAAMATQKQQLLAQWTEEDFLARAEEKMHAYMQNFKSRFMLLRADSGNVHCLEKIYVRLPVTPGAAGGGEEAATAAEKKQQRSSRKQQQKLQQVSVRAITAVRQVSPSTFALRLLHGYSSAAPPAAKTGGGEGAAAKSSSSAAAAASTASAAAAAQATLSLISQALRNAPLGLNVTMLPAEGGATQEIIVDFPPLSEDLRLQLIHQAKTEAEEGRVAIRRLRHKLLEELREVKNKNLVGEDRLKKLQGKVQQLTEKSMEELNVLLATKEKQLKKM